MDVTRELIEKKLSQLLVDDEAGWEAAASWIAAKAYDSEGVDMSHDYDSPEGFSSSLMTQLYHDRIKLRFPRGVESLNEYEIAEELVWVLAPPGIVFER